MNQRVDEMKNWLLASLISYLDSNINNQRGSNVMLLYFWVFVSIQSLIRYFFGTLKPFLVSLCHMICDLKKNFDRKQWFFLLHSILATFWIFLISMCSKGGYNGRYLMYCTFGWRRQCLLAGNLEMVQNFVFYLRSVTSLCASGFCLLAGSTS